jgi:hypothetical protein
MSEPSFLSSRQDQFGQRIVFFYGADEPNAYDQAASQNAGRLFVCLSCSLIASTLFLFELSCDATAMFSETLQAVMTSQNSSRSIVTGLIYQPYQFRRDKSVIEASVAQVRATTKRTPIFGRGKRVRRAVEHWSGHWM